MARSIKYPVGIQTFEKIITGHYFSDISDIHRDFVPLLYQAGYLTIKGYDRVSKEYTLGFPNREVYEGFWEALSSYFFPDQNF